MSPDHVLACHAMLDLAGWASIAAIVGIPIAVVGVFYAGYQMFQNTKISRARFWLDLEEMFTRHDEVHIKLRPGGDWSYSHSGPVNAQEWSKVEDYMGLFEHCELMLRRRLIDWDTFEKIFSYRLHNIIGNQVIADAKLREEKESWELFVSLLQRLRTVLPT